MNFLYFPTFFPLLFVAPSLFLSSFFSNSILLWSFPVQWLTWTDLINWIDTRRMVTAKAFQSLLLPLRFGSSGKFLQPALKRSRLAIRYYWNYWTLWFDRLIDWLIDDDGRIVLLLLRLNRWLWLCSTMLICERWLIRHSAKDWWRNVVSVPTLLSRWPFNWLIIGYSTWSIFNDPFELKMVEYQRR